MSGAGARPRLLPGSRWARWALLLLVVFALLRGGMWAATQPYFWAPDEDYHFLYAEHLTTQGALPSPGEPLYPREYDLVRREMRYESYASGPRAEFAGDPKASVRRLEGLPRRDREPRFEGRGVNVVHAPLYYATAAGVNAALGDASPFVRVGAVRALSAVLGALAVFLAWLLAAQVLRQQWLQLTAAALVALQPMLGFMSGVVSNDMAVTAAFTAALAMLLFVMRAPPVPAQGLWVGGTVATALLVKSTALALLPLAVLAYGAQLLTWRERRRTALRSAGLALGLVGALAGWWYARSLVEYGSLTGAATAIVPGGVPAATPGEVAGLVSEWTRLTYRTYWWHFHWWEAPRESVWFLVPAAVGAIGMVGLAAALHAKRGTLLSRRDPLLRHALLLVAAVLVLYLPPLAADVLRRVEGDGFILVAGRFMLPAYPAAVVLLLIGLRRLAPRRLLAPACAVLVALAAGLSWAAWLHVHVHRYFGEGGWPELFRRMSFDRPEFVTPTTFTIALIATLGAFAGCMAVMLLHALGERGWSPGRAAIAGPARIARRQLTRS